MWIHLEEYKTNKQTNKQSVYAIGPMYCMQIHLEK